MNDYPTIQKVFEQLEFGEEEGGVRWWKWARVPEFDDLKMALKEIADMQMELARLRRIEAAARGVTSIGHKYIADVWLDLRDHDQMLNELQDALDAPAVEQP